jgi:hypothetical protein
MADGNAARTFAERSVRDMVASAASADPESVRPKKRKRTVTRTEDDRKGDADPEIASSAHASVAATAPAFEFVSVNVAAQRTGLPKQTIKIWAAGGLIGSLRPGSDASHRLIDWRDLLHYIEMKRERPDAATRGQLEHDSKVDKRRTLIWVRGGPSLVDAQGVKLSKEVAKKHCDELQERVGQRIERMLRIDPATRVFGLELSDSNHWGRRGFRDLLVNYVMSRRIECLVISDRDQICKAEMWPVFEWLCRLCEVVIKLAPISLAAADVSAAAAAPAAAAAAASPADFISNADANAAAIGHAITPRSLEK